MSEKTTVERMTTETQIRLEIQRGTGKSTVATGVPFLDHMMITFARYSGLDMKLEVTGDLRHHIIEDVAIAMGRAVPDVMPSAAARYGERTIPMDEALVQACVDMGGRPFYRGPLPSGLYNHWMRSFADNARATIHIRILRGSDRHHIIEAAFKAVALAIRDAMQSSGDGAVFSTKGAVSLEVL